MSIVGGVLIYLIIWWVVLFAVLPIGVRNAYEEGVELVPGQADGAPVARSVGRVTFGGAAAMGLTTGVGSLFGALE